MAWYNAADLIERMLGIWPRDDASSNLATIPYGRCANARPVGVWPGDDETRALPTLPGSKLSS